MQSKISLIETADEGSDDDNDVERKHTADGEEIFVH